MAEAKKKATKTKSKAKAKDEKTEEQKLDEKAAKHKPTKAEKEQELAETKAKPNFPLPDVATDPATQEAKERIKEDDAGTNDEAASHEAHVQENDNGVDTAERLKDEAKQAEKARKSEKTRTNDINKAKLKDYGFEQDKDSVSMDTTWRTYAVDGDRDECVYARRIDQPFKVGQTTVDDPNGGYLVVKADGNGTPKAVTADEFNAEGAYVEA